MVLHTKHYSLTLNKNKCKGCGVCMTICPKEAIEATRTPKEEKDDILACSMHTQNISRARCYLAVYHK